MTRDGQLARLVRSLRNQGRAEGSAWLEHLLLGYNYRMDELSAAIGISQLKRIDTFRCAASGSRLAIRRFSGGSTGSIPPWSGHTCA